MLTAAAKAPGDFVSRADLEAQEAAVALIRTAHPTHRIVAEETPAQPNAVRPTGSGGVPQWIIDPLDGTANFLHGHPMYASSVAVARSGAVVAGAVTCATTGERWWATRGGGAWKNGRRIRVSSLRELEGALIGTGFPFKAKEQIPTYALQLGAVLRAGAGVRRGGSAALDLCYLAEGRFDAFWELFLNPWDFAAGSLIVEEAGGKMSDAEGHALRLEAGGVVGANSRELADRVQTLLMRSTEAPEAGSVRG